MVVLEIVRPVIFREYDAAESPAEMENIPELTAEQLAKLKAEFDDFALEHGLKLIRVKIKNRNLSVQLEMPIERSPDEICETFDQWFVHDNCPTWTFDLIPRERWIELGYEESEGEK